MFKTKILASILLSLTLLISVPAQAGITSKLAFMAGTAFLVHALKNPENQQKIINYINNHSEAKTKVMNGLSRIINNPKHQALKEKATIFMDKVKQTPNYRPSKQDSI